MPLPSAPAGLPMPEKPEGGGPPMGGSPATGPTDNAGSEVQGAQAAAAILDAASKLLPMVGASTDIGREIMKFMQGMSKLVPAGSVSPASKQNQLDSMQRNNMQNSRNLSLVKQQGAQGAPGAQPPPAAPAAAA